MYEISIINNGKRYLPIIEGDVTWETSRMGEPGKLTFSIVNDDELDFQEGNPVIFKADDENIFFGFVFMKSRDKEQIIKVTAYDQLRYLKNKDTYVYTKKKASDVVKMIAKDFNLKAGGIADTGYVIPSRIRENMTLFDIIYDALDLTLLNRRKLYVLYDDFGKLTLKDVETMKVPDLVLGELNSQNFSYTTDIDSDTYNKVKLYRENEKSGKREIYIAQDGKNMNNWGVLQYFDKVDEDTNAKVKAESILKLKNKKKRTLQLKDVIGDTRVRAGASAMILMRDIGDISVKQYMLVEKAKHVFSNDEHWMTLDLRGDI
ncbi:XkdQ/YqbQ family protein [Clostridium sp. Cult1]|uniref:XkdQ/YqbQ family protein n=1 Tax=Clostridium sp. Cult1 TaxID=2079002 RepID=UPI001F425860|nr:hydrolase [Clostridium sp. Cult1]MCF6464210.1 hydrolase [Clostridium sp. Cult1]